MDNELKTNAKSLSPEEQYQIRKSIVRMSKQGKTNPEIAEILDVSERHVRNVKQSYATHGIAGIKPKTRGRKTGAKRILSNEQEEEIQQIIVDKNPDQLRLPGCMWTRKDNMNADKLIDFMRRLVRDTDKKVFLILDNLRVHHSKKVTAWLAKHRDEIEIFYLPPYAPEYNPDELLNSDLKRGVGNRAMPKSEADLEHNVRSHLKMLQLNPEKITSFFRAELTCYAA